MIQDVVFSPQITVEQVALLAEQGFKTIINNRPDGEESGQPNSAEIAEACADLGIVYKAVQFAGGELTEGQVTEFAEFFSKATKPVFMFCRTGNRSNVIYQTAEQMGLLGE